MADSDILLVLTLISVTIIIAYAFKTSYSVVRLQLFHAVKLPIALAILIAYLLTPLLLIDGAYTSNVNTIATLRHDDNRTDQPLFMDRDPYIKDAENDYVETFANERLQVTGDLRANADSIVSIQGTFVDNDSIVIHQLHEFHNHWRDIASYAGLLIIAFYWLFRLVKEIND